MLTQIGATAIGIRTNEGVVLAVEKKLPSVLMDPSSVEKLQEIDTHIGCASSGLAGDAKTLIDHARVECQSHRFSYNEPLSLEAVTQSVSDLAINFGADKKGGDKSKKKKMSRPFGVSLLVGGIDEHGPALYQTDPSGTYLKWDARAIGSAAEGAQAYIQESYQQDMSIEEAKKLALQTLKNVMEEKINKYNVEMATLKVEDKQYHVYSVTEIEDIIKTLS